MKTALFPLFVLLIVVSTAHSQSLPSESPKASISQRVGLSDIKISYSRPNVRERQIFGTLVPYGEVWRTGANYPTKIEFTDTTFIQGKHKLPPGSYALYTIPYPNKWTVIFSTNTGLWGSYGYQEKDDALRIEIQPDNNAAFHESFTIQFTDLAHDKARIQLNWDKTEVSFEVSIDIQQRVITSINQKIAEEDTSRSKWTYYWMGADYLLKKDTSLDLALAWITESMKLEEVWLNYWTGAEVNAKLGNYKEAVRLGNRAIEIGSKEENKPYFPYGETYRKQIEIWSKELSH